jgi:cytochrome c-type biogenesis protein CcmH
MQYYVSQYGEKVLAEPSKKGFNLVAWLTPFVALIVGAVAVYYLVTTWAKRHRVPISSETGAAGESRSDVPDELTRRLEDELKTFD